MNKLEPIANTISHLLFDAFNILPEYEFEKEFDWLTTHPKKQLFINGWKDINDVYRSVTSNKIDLNKLEENDLYYDKNTKQKVDIWFTKPFNFIVEFDEKQHFNQFRLSTLKKYNSNWMTGDINHYKHFSEQNIAKPGISGFQKIRPNLLFPYFYEGNEKQDNRIRQRAFRDFLKDFLPFEFGLNPTLRIPYTVVNKKIKDFNHNDLENLKKYLIENNLCERIKLI